MKPGQKENSRARTPLSGRGYKLTRERREIMEEILTIEGHFDPESLLNRLKAKGSTVSRASVYRTLPVLVECGYICEAEKTDRHAHYERLAESHHHDHMVCLGCGKVIEFYSPHLEDLQVTICERERFRPLRHSLDILGYCEECAD